MLDEAEARALAEQTLRRQVGPARELQHGWFFPIREIGSRGVIVHKVTGRPLAVGSALPLERQLAAYDRGWHAHLYELVILAHDLRATRRAICSLGTVDRNRRPLRDLDVWEHLDRLPCTFTVAVYGRWEILAEARTLRSFEFELHECEERPGSR